MSAKPTCLIVASASPQGVSAKSFLQCFSLCSTAFNLQTATPGVEAQLIALHCDNDQRGEKAPLLTGRRLQQIPANVTVCGILTGSLQHFQLMQAPRCDHWAHHSAVGKTIDFVGVDESTARWVQDFNVKSYATPAKLESIDDTRRCSSQTARAPNDLAHSGSMHRILTQFISQQKPVCAVGQGVSALCCATEGQRWIFSGYSLTGPSVFELVRQPDFANLPLIVEDFVKDSGGSYTASQEDAVHMVVDRHLITGQNLQSTSLAVNNLILLCNAK